MNDKDKKKLNSIQLDILNEIKRICEKNNIKYFLTGGTCLGAIRHNGFIPWDDDIDIGMLRDDYNKFLKVCEKDLEEKYFLQTNETDKNYPNAFAKVRANNTLFLEKINVGKDLHVGIFVDVFPYDYTSNNKFYRKYLQVKTLLIRVAILIKLKYPEDCFAKNRGLSVKLIKLICPLFSLKSLWKMLNRNINKYNKKKKKTNYISNFVGGLLYKDLYDADLFDEINYHVFEKETYPILKDYDRYLTGLYKDYMTPPPLDKRDSGHGLLEVKFNTKEKRGL